MLTTIRQVNEEFFRKFYGLKMLMGGVEKTVLCRYAKKSSYDYVEEQANQIYPCIAIQDYTPTPKKEWYIDMHAYFGGKSLNGLTGYLYQRPIWMEFRYDVSIAAKSYNDFIAMQDYFMENFVYGKRFIFNQQLSGEDTVGDIVPYEIRETDIPRTDGVFEMNYEFTCSVWLYPQTPEEVELIQTIVLSVQPRSIMKELKTLISSDNKVIITKDGYIYGASTFQSKFTADEIEGILTKAILSDNYEAVRKMTVKDYENLEVKDEKTLYILTEND